MRIRLNSADSLAFVCDNPFHWLFRNPGHGPQTWPWWRLLSVSVVKCMSGDRVIPLSWNAWFYTRWGSLCWHLHIDTRTPAQRYGVQS